MTEDRSAPARIVLVEEVEVTCDLLPRCRQWMGRVGTTANDGQESFDLTNDRS